MSDSRSKYRRQPVNYLEIYDPDEQKFMGNVVDITTEGVRLSSEKPLKPGCRYRMRLRLPEEISGQTEVVFEGICRWCNEYHQGFLAGYYGAGLELTNMTPRIKETLTLLINGSWFRDWRQLPNYEAIRRESGYPLR